mgnify:CR=1 FL=1
MTVQTLLGGYLVKKGTHAKVASLLADRPEMVDSRFVPGVHQKLPTILMGASPLHIAAYVSPPALRAVCWLAACLTCVVAMCRAATTMT